MILTDSKGRRGAVAIESLNVDRESKVDIGRKAYRSKLEVKQFDLCTGGPKDPKRECGPLRETK